MFTHMSVDSVVRLGLGFVLFALFVATTCVCAVILKRQIIAAWNRSNYSFFGAGEFHVPYPGLAFCLAAGPMIAIYIPTLFMYEETLKQAGLL
jgi:hypothetical protein